MPLRWSSMSSASSPSSFALARLPSCRSRAEVACLVRHHAQGPALPCDLNSLQHQVASRVQVARHLGRNAQHMDSARPTPAIVAALDDIQRLFAIHTADVATHGSGRLPRPTLMFSDPTGKLAGRCLGLNHEFQSAQLRPTLEHRRIADIAEEDNRYLLRLRVGPQT